MIWNFQKHDYHPFITGTKIYSNSFMSSYGLVYHHISPIIPNMPLFLTVGFVRQDSVIDQSLNYLPTPPLCVCVCVWVRTRAHTINVEEKLDHRMKMCHIQDLTDDFLWYHLACYSVPFLSFILTVIS